MKNINKNFFSCHQKWDKMPTKGDKRWCESCSQCVTDFRKMPILDIESTHKNSDTKVCGIYTETQLIQLYPPDKPVFNFSPYKKKVAAAVLAFFSLGAAANAQRDSLIFDKQHKLVCPIQTTVNQAKKVQKEVSSTAKVIAIKGTVRDSTTEEALIGVSIFLKGSTRGTVSDFDGNYELSFIKGSMNTLVFNYVGYKPYEILVTSNQVIFDVYLRQSAVFCTLGAITARKARPWHRMFWQRLFNKWR